MDDNNKYNRNKDYEPDNFDDEVAFPARRNNAPERSSDIQEDYGDNFDNDVKFVGDYDEDAVQMPEIDFEDDMETPVKCRRKGMTAHRLPTMATILILRQGSKCQRLQRIFSMTFHLTILVTTTQNQRYTQSVKRLLKRKRERAVMWRLS